jgi:hypothetical protein
MWMDVESFNAVDMSNHVSRIPLLIQLQYTARYHNTRIFKSSFIWYYINNNVDIKHKKGNDQLRIEEQTIQCPQEKYNDLQNTMQSSNTNTNLTINQGSVQDLLIGLANCNHIIYTIEQHQSYNIESLLLFFSWNKR